MKIQITKEPRSESGRKRGASFVNCLIVLCLTMCIVITLWTVWEYHRLDLPLGAAELGVLCGIWGGELLLIVVRQVLGSDVRKRGAELERQCDEPEA